MKFFLGKSDNINMFVILIVFIVLEQDSKNIL